jgi:hypothetical protein
MKKILLSIAGVAMLACFLPFLKADNAPTPARFEYITIRWGGRENTQLIGPKGKVEFIGAKLFSVPKRDRVDERAFYMNLALNTIAKDGYEMAAIINPDEIIVRRLARDATPPPTEDK